ncbi:MAG: helix-turn-helix domain-containing protein [Saprospiraceae bacterium]
MKVQLALIKACKEKIEGSNLAQELSELLHVNVDGAYRRMRGSTELTISEIQLICKHFNISFDSIMLYQSNLVPFHFNTMFKERFHIVEYLENIASALKALSVGKNVQIAMTAMDLPYFRQFGFKNLSRFKLFFWQRSVLNLDSHRHKKFNAEEVVEDFEQIVEKINYYYHGVDSYEIWAPETIDRSIKEIQYYVDSGLIESKEDFDKICDDLDDLLNTLERQAETGKKSINNKYGILHSNFEMYQSDIFISNNCIQAETKDETYTYITFNSFNHLMTFSKEFSEECQKWMEQMRSKSILLSEVSEKLRYQFFLSQRKKITYLRSLYQTI